MPNLNLLMLTLDQLTPTVDHIGTNTRSLWHPHFITWDIQAGSHWHSHMITSTQTPHHTDAFTESNLTAAREPTNAHFGHISFHHVLILRLRVIVCVGVENFNFMFCFFFFLSRWWTLGCKLQLISESFQKGTSPGTKAANKHHRERFQSTRLRDLFH